MTEFLTKLLKEKKIELVEPSQDICNSYFKKSRSNLESAKILQENQKFEEVISLVYYSMYNLVLALLFRVGIKSENHSGSIILLKDIFRLDTSLIEEAKKERIDKQYYVISELNEISVKKSIGNAEEFNSFLKDFISKLNSNSIKDYRRKLGDCNNVYK